MYVWCRHGTGHFIFGVLKPEYNRYRLKAVLCMYVSKSSRGLSFICSHNRESTALAARSAPFLMEYICNTDLG